MNDYERLNIESLFRVDGFGVANAADFKNTKGEQYFLRIKNGLQQLEQHGISRASLSSAGKIGTARKSAAAKELKRDLRDIRDTARTIAKEEAAFINNFIIPPNNLNYPNLLETSKQFARDLPEVKAKFIEMGMPADFIEDLTEDIEEFEAALGLQTDSKREEIGDSAEIDAILEELLDVKESINTVANNIYKRNPQKLAEWLTAYHVERPPRRKKNEEPPTS